jgi:hypothetical protein
MYIVFFGFSTEITPEPTALVEFSEQPVVEFSEQPVANEKIFEKDDSEARRRSKR